MADGGVFGDREQFWRDHIAGWKSMSLRLYSEEHGLKHAGLLELPAESPGCRCAGTLGRTRGDVFGGPCCRTGGERAGAAG